MNQAIQEKNEEITAQARLLEDVNREMERINTNLEGEVQQRSQRLVEQSKKLVEYAYFNAHHLRGPLARILGLISLLQLQKLSADQEDIVQKMDISAQELDVVVKEINKRLDEELP
jgi:signal transduction histidine kinase